MKKKKKTTERKKRKEKYKYKKTIKLSFCNKLHASQFTQRTNQMLLFGMNMRK